MTTDTDTAFNPAKYLSDLKGKDYMEVKWRLLWLRTEQPDALIQTEMIDHGPDFAIFKAEIVIPGHGSATGWGHESADDFRDFLEKAETKAVGRACAALGYGTQFAVADYDEGDSATDAPLPRPGVPQGDAWGDPMPAGQPRSAEKLMPLKYAGNCTDCGYKIAVGTQALYNGSARSVRHQFGECPDAAQGFVNTDEV